MKTSVMGNATGIRHVLLFLILCCVHTRTASSARTDEDGGISNKNKREAGGPSGLFPFPRVGRGGPDTWLLDTTGKHLFQEGGIFFTQPDIIYQTKPVTAPQTTETEDYRIMGLNTFPRVGRSEYNQQSDSNTLQGFMKRQGLVPFPRIGRSGGKQNIGNNAAADNTQNGLWFGPRLGRLQKRDSFESPWALVTLREFPSITSRQQPEAFTPRLGRESSEDIWDDYEHQRTSTDRL
ncbi:cardio acceleratory peptide capability [Lycorma delicatula]|uniref:cardio acceleratory peptide capability n=1 Tax=Lycorma delicatula TaxID=130591 RepID=UPI003F516616